MTLNFKTAASAATWSFVPWGWTDPAGPHLDFRWGGNLDRTKLDARWSVADCDGDAWMLCFDSTKGGEGLAELNRYDLADYQAVRRDIEEFGRREALRRHAYRFYRSFRNDRETGCPTAYAFHPFRPRSTEVAGRVGIRYGFVVRDEEGVAVERTTSFATVTRTRLVIVVASALTGRACLGIEGPTFRPAELKRVEPYLARLAADGRLPR
jgi:hypothetical protein